MELATSFLNKLSGVLGNPHIVNEVLPTEYNNLSPIEQNGQLKLFQVQHFIDCVLVHPTKKNMLIRMFRMSKAQANAAKTAFRSLSSHMPYFYTNFTAWYSINKMTCLSELIRKYENWSSVHIAVQAGLLEVLTKHDAGHMVNNQFCDKARSPMHLACDLNQIGMLEKCVLIGGNLSLQDENGDTALHYAVCKCSKRFVKFICEKMTKDALDVQNIDGETALHVAIKEKKTDFAKMILDAGTNVKKCSKVGFPIHYALKYADSRFTSYMLQKYPSQVKFVCKKHDSLPIHWCRTAEDVNLLVSSGSKVVFTNATSDTPLHVMILKDRLDAAIGLIFQHADINVKGKNGNTPLHLAIMNDNKTLVKMLLLFGADCQAKNDFDQTPGLLALQDSKRNKETIVHLLSEVGGIVLGKPEKSRVGQKINTVRADFIPKTSKESSPPRAKILCLDGGGIRGLILAQILIAIEEETGKKTIDLFDWICGTSTGGLLALALSRGNRAVDCQSIYFRLKDQVFSGPRPYDSVPMEKFLKEIFGEHTTLAQIPPHPKIVVTSVHADERPAKLHLFRNYEPAHLVSSGPSGSRVLKKAQSMSFEDILRSPMDTPLWQVARSSGAAPTYFRPMGNFVDGGLMSNNPTLDILTEIHFHNKALRKKNRFKDDQSPGLVVSLGTGIVPIVKVKSIDVNPSTNPLVLVSSAFAGFELTQIMIDAACECNGHIHDRATAWCDSINAAYYRLTPQLKEDVAMNEVNDEKLVDMLWTTKLYVQKNKHVVQEIAHLLLNNQ